MRTWAGMRGAGLGTPETTVNPFGFTRLGCSAPISVGCVNGRGRMNQREVVVLGAILSRFSLSSNASLGGK